MAKKNKTLKSPQVEETFNDSQVEETFNDSQVEETFEHSGKFWRRNIFVKGHGVVKGKVTEKDFELFKKAIPKDVFKEIDLSKYLSTRDVHTEWNKAHQKKRSRG